MKSEREWCEFKSISLILFGLQIGEELEWNSIDLQGDWKSMQWISFANVWRRRSKRKWEFLMLKFVFRCLYIVFEEMCLLVKRWREMSLHLKFEILKKCWYVDMPKYPMSTWVCCKMNSNTNKCCKFLAFHYHIFVVFLIWLRSMVDDLQV